MGGFLFGGNCNTRFKNSKRSDSFRVFPAPERSITHPRVHVNLITEQGVVAGITLATCRDMLWGIRLRRHGPWGRAGRMLDLLRRWSSPLHRGADRAAGIRSGESNLGNCGKSAIFKFPVLIGRLHRLRARAGGSRGLHSRAASASPDAQTHVPACPQCYPWPPGRSGRPEERSGWPQRPQSKKRFFLR